MLIDLFSDLGLRGRCVLGVFISSVTISFFFQSCTRLDDARRAHSHVPRYLRDRYCQFSHPERLLGAVERFAIQDTTSRMPY